VAAPVSVAHTHVHSIRLASGPEALVARVRIADGTQGFGFTLNDDAGLARDMAAWDALARSKGLPLHSLLGGSYRSTVNCVDDPNPAISPDWSALRKGILDNKYDLLRIDPFAWGSLEQVTTIAAAAAAFDLGIALLAPNAHAWEIQYCAALAATLRGDDTRIIVRKEGKDKAINVSGEPGIGIDWSIEPAFGKIQWQS
jgi:L-alanine-DL-glutamate epimerase-like enolase superfamily enzyme